MMPAAFCHCYPCVPTLLSLCWLQALPPAGQTVAQVAVPLTAVVAAGVVSVNKVTRAVDEKTSAVKTSVEQKKAAVKKSVEESPLGAAKLKVRRPCPRLSARHGRTPKHLPLAPALALAFALGLPLPLPLPLPLVLSGMCNACLPQGERRARVRAQGSGRLGRELGRARPYVGTVADRSATRGHARGGGCVTLRAR